MDGRLEHLDPKMINIHGERRPLVEDKLAPLMESVKRLGVLEPIVVRRPSGLMPVLVAGRHRLEAARRLKLKTVPCIIRDMDDIDAELAEIDENLIRAELTPAQTAAALTRRKELYEAKHPETGHGKATKNKEEKISSFANDTASATGQTARNVRNATRRGEQLGGDLDRVTGTPLDKGVELDALLKLPADEREELIARAEAGDRTVTARKPVSPPDDVLNDIEVNNKQRNDLIRVWNRTAPENRRWFYDLIGDPMEPVRRPHLEAAE